MTAIICGIVSDVQDKQHLVRVALRLQGDWIGTAEGRQKLQTAVKHIMGLKDKSLPSTIREEAHENDDCTNFSIPCDNLRESIFLVRKLEGIIRQNAWAIPSQSMFRGS